MKPKLSELCDDRIALEEHKIEQIAGSAEDGLDLQGGTSETRRREAEDCDQALKDAVEMSKNLFVMMAKNNSFDHQNMDMPIECLQLRKMTKESFKNVAFDLPGQTKVEVLEFINKGTFGSVFRCKVTINGETAQCALKIQDGESTDHAMLEHCLMLKLAGDGSEYCPFSRTLQLHMYSNGGLLFMHDESHSGRTLLDVAKVLNTLQEKELIDNKKRVPLAIYLVSRLLKHFVTLHIAGYLVRKVYW